MNISVIGLGKLGLCTALCFASKGHKVYGFDANPKLLDNLKNNKIPIDETGITALWMESRNNIVLCHSIEEVVINSDISLVIVPTPSLPNGEFTNELIETVIRKIAMTLKKKNEFHIIDVVSTVMPGSTMGIFKPLVEEISGKKCPNDFGLVYNPEFIALGSVISNFLNPDMVLIGASDKRSAELTKNIYKSTCNNSPYFALMSPLNAEITKLSLNCFITTKISFANELSTVCESIEGADVDEITHALGADKRIGKNYLSGGLGYGGPCFPRDNAAFQAFSKKFHCDAHISQSTVLVNNNVITRLYILILDNVERGETISLFGLSYKANTAIIEESQSTQLAEKLLTAGYKIRAHDPAALYNVKQLFGDRIEIFSNEEDCIRDVKAVVLLTFWPEYEKLHWKRLSSLMANDGIIIDCWRKLKKTPLVGVRYTALGLGTNGT